MHTMTFEILAEVDATELFSEGEDANSNWNWCMERANFKHRDDDACEFIVHIGDEDYWKQTVKEMSEEGCTKEFIAMYLAAKDAGAQRVLFYA